MMSSAQVRKFGRCDREGGMQFLKAALALPESTSEVDVPSITVRCFGTSNSYGGARQETRGPRNIPRSWGNAKPLLPSKRICRKARYPFPKQEALKDRSQYDLDDICGQADNEGRYQ